MDRGRRDFLKTLGLLAATAPAGIAALKQVQPEAEAEAPPAAPPVQDEQDCSGSMMFGWVSNARIQADGATVMYTPPLADIVFQNNKKEA